MNIKKLIGLKAENLAKQYLLGLKYNILDTNYKTKFGEIDIIAYDKEENCLVFVEVRYRKNSAYGYPQESVDFYKRLKILKSAFVFIKKSHFKNVSFRFDIISIMLNNKIDHIKNAFSIDLDRINF